MNNRIAIISCLILVFVSLFNSPILASDVLVLEPNNFDDYVGGDQPILVEFFAPWCGHCKALAPEYEIVASAFKSLPVRVASVDADQHRELGSRFGVTGFPTLKFFPRGVKEAQDYNDGRTANDIIAFLNQQTNSRARVKKTESSVVDLDPSNFDSIVLDESVDCLVEFYAPWCGHCKQLAPVYSQVGDSFVGETQVVVAKIDADAHRDLGSRYGVTGFPTIKFFPKNNKAGEDYTGGRSAEDFVSFLNARTGAQRIVGGAVSPIAGTVPVLDALVTRFIESSSLEEQKSILSEAENVSDAGVESLKNYITIFKKIIEGKKDYAQTEIVRLNKLLSVDTVKPTQRVNFSKRLNVLKRFTAVSA